MSVPKSNVSGVIQTTPVQSNSLSYKPSLPKISIAELETGKLDIDSVIEEIRELKAKIPTLRYDMVIYIRLLATLEESFAPNSVYQEIQRRIIILKQNIDDYYALYSRLLPVIRYTKLKAGINPDDIIKVVRHEVSVDAKLIAPPVAPTTTTNNTNLVTTNSKGTDSKNNNINGSNSNSTNSTTTTTGTSKPKKPRQRANSKKNKNNNNNSNNDT
ncbi:hypothetical protein BVG19_g2576 [[Candida] boidinii]|nr:hypothetical protein BVG19_g2576 [[Candida] boidinii]OWB49156.1 hypothetical protein B5S27_g696 [[Candida] boidinii]